MARAKGYRGSLLTALALSRPPLSDGIYPAVSVTTNTVKVSLIAAVAENGIIGADGDVPWHYPADLTHFKRTTTGHPVIMGRTTFESIERDVGGPLPNRRNIVLSTTPDRLPDSVIGVASPSAALAAADSRDDSTVYVIGGATVYEQFLPRADELLLTELDDPHEGDTTFPAVAWDRWTESAREPHDAFDIVTYVRRSDDDTRR